MTHDQWCLEHIRAARWFAAKDRPIHLVALTELPWWCEPTSQQLGVRSEIAEVQDPAGRREFYHLLLAYGPGDQPVRDATEDPAAMSAMWNALAGCARRAGGSTRVRLFGSLPEAPPARRFGGEQSNTSVLYGDLGLLKIFRLLAPGRNPDIEIHELLTRRRGPMAEKRVHTADLLGVLRASWFSGSAGPHAAPLEADLAMLVEQITDAADGWELALQRCREAAEFPATELGEALGTVHTLLADARGTELVSGHDLATRLRTRIEAHVAAAPELEPHATGLATLVDRIDTAGQVALQRVHGDAHLGQAMLAGDGWKLIDFEGEPATAIPQRLLPDSPARDVAGFLRSFAYAAATVGRTDGLDRTGWLRTVSADFISGWTRASPHPVADELITAYEAERAAYEVGYEKRSRPDWVEIPLGDVARLATQEVAR